jgi:NADH-quinone oxidoreductase subunit I
MIRWGIVKGLGVTLKHFGQTYIEDLRYFWDKYVARQTAQPVLDYRMAPESRGIYTIQYPEEKPHIPERFRFLPFLVTDYEGDDPVKRREANRCTSCGICAKVCPPQCIWIVRATGEDGKPISLPAEYYIDIDICMNCGYCAEFCPFDAIIMDHDYAIADYERQVGHIHDLDRLLKPASYYRQIRPTQYAAKEEERRLAEEEKRRKEEERARKLAAKKAAAAQKAKTPAKAATEPKTKEKAAAPAKRKRTPEEIKAAREAMLAKKRAREEQQQKEGNGSPTSEEK